MSVEYSDIETSSSRFPVYEIIGVALALAIWALLAAFFDKTLLPSPPEVFNALKKEASSASFYFQIFATLKDIGVSFIIGSASGVALGLIIGGSTTVNLFLSPYVYSIYSLPKVALIPLFVVWLGIGTQTIIVVTSIAVALLVAINTIDGVKSVDPIFIRAAKNLGAGRLQIFLHVVLPAASGMIFSGLRLGVGQALITGVAAEIVLAGSGLGALMWDSQQTLDTDVVFLCLICLAIISVASTWLLGVLDRVLFPWRHHEIE